MPAAVDLSGVQVVPERILERKMVKRHNKVQVQVLIQWSGLAAEAATWEDYDVLKNRFPDAPAWGHAATQEGGIVSTATTVLTTTTDTEATYV